MYFGGTPLEQQPKKKKKRRPGPLRRAYRALVSLSAVIVVLFVAWKLAIRPPKVPQPSALPISTPGQPGSSTGQDPPDPTASPVGLERRDRVYTFLLIAKDQIGASTDTLLIATYDVPGRKVGLVSIPRDTLVDRRVGPYHYYKLNAAYGNAETNAVGTGIAELETAVSELLGLPIDYHVMVDIPSFIRIVDAVGGVDFQVPVKMDYDDPSQDLHIHYEPRLYQGLTGQQVMEIARCRKNSIWKNGSYTLYDAYPDAEIGRTHTQQDLLKAIAKKLLSWQSIPKLTELVGIVNESVETDMPLDDMLYFAQNAAGLELSTGLSTATFPGRGDVVYRGRDWCYQYDKTASLDLINTLLNPYTAPVTEDMVKMIQAKK